MIKCIVLMRRNPALTHEQMVEYHKKNHAPLFMSVPEVQQNVRRYIQSHPIPAELGGFQAAPFDGITEIWFDDINGFNALLKSDAYLTIIRPDEMKFIDRGNSPIMVTVETPIGKYR